MKISDFLSVGDVMIDIAAANKSQLLLEMSRKAARSVNLPAEQIYTALEKREQLGSTGMGAGAAIPHARLSGLDMPLAVVARLKAPIDFDAIDGEPVDLAVMLLMPVPPRPDDLAMLALIARKLKIKGDVEKMRSAVSADEFFTIFAAQSSGSFQDVTS